MLEKRIKHNKHKVLQVIFSSQCHFIPKCICWDQNEYSSHLIQNVYFIVISGEEGDRESYWRLKGIEGIKAGRF